MGQVNYNDNRIYDKCMTWEMEIEQEKKAKISVEEVDNLPAWW